MKKINKKLSLKKISIAQIEKLNTIKGGINSFEPETSHSTYNGTCPQTMNLCDPITLDNQPTVDSKCTYTNIACDENTPTK